MYNPFGPATDPRRRLGAVRCSRWQVGLRQVGPAADDDDGVGGDAFTTAAAARDGAAKINGRRDRSMYTRYTHTARGRLVRETRAASATVERREKNR